MQGISHYRVREYRRGDEEGITRLFREVFGKEITIAQWNWKYWASGNGRIYSKIVEDEAGTIMGHAGAIPLRGVVDNRPIQFFQIADVMVHRKARGFWGRKNVFDRLMKCLFEDLGKAFSDVFCYGFPGTRPFILGERIKVYDRIGRASENVKHLRRSLVTLYKAQTIAWDDERLDDLWTRLSIEFPFSLIRDKRYLNWRYATNPFFSYRLFGFFLLGKLKGWAVTRDADQEVLIVDLLTEPRRYMGTLKALENHLFSQGKKNLHLWLPERWKKHIKGYAIKDTEVVVTNMVWKLPIQTSTARENFYYTMGDTDIF